MGATGVGKTTLQNHGANVPAQNGLQTVRRGCEAWTSMRGFIEAVGGTHFRLASGEPTGLNPFPTSSIRGKTVTFSMTWWVRVAAKLARRVPQRTPGDIKQ